MLTKAKNVALAGVRSLTIMDDKECDNIDLGTHFFLNADHVNKKIKRLIR